MSTFIILTTCRFRTVLWSGDLFFGVNGVSHKHSIPAKITFSLIFHSSLLPQQHPCKHQVEKASSIAGCEYNLPNQSLGSQRGEVWERLQLPKIVWNSKQSSKRSKEASPISQHAAVTFDFTHLFIRLPVWQT